MRAFAIATGQSAKTKAIDARLLAQPDRATGALAALLARPRKLVA
ncbi:MAG: hypothetical protein ABI856_09005 [Nitrospira sp.]